MMPYQPPTRPRVRVLETGVAGFRASVMNGPDVDLLGIAGLGNLSELAADVEASWDWLELLESVGSATVIEEGQFEGGPGASDTFYRIEIDDPQAFAAELREALLGRIVESIRDALRRRRRTPAADRSPSVEVEVIVEWGYLAQECPLSLRTMAEILEGKPVRRTQWYAYEGKRYLGRWYFNENQSGTLDVRSDDGDLWLGSLSSAIIIVRRDRQTRASGRES